MLVGENNLCWRRYLRKPKKNIRDCFIFLACRSIFPPFLKKNPSQCPRPSIFILNHQYRYNVHTVYLSSKRATDQHIKCHAQHKECHSWLGWNKYVHIYIYIYIIIYTYMCVCVCVCVYMCMCVCVVSEFIIPQSAIKCPYSRQNMSISS